MRRFWAAVLAGVVAGGVLVAVPPPVTTASAAPAPPVATPSVPIRSERFVLTGSLSTKVVRPVQLQAKSGKKWKKIATGKTDKTGRYSLSTSSGAASITVRVVAPKTKVKHKKYKAITTKTRTITPTAVQTADLRMPATAQVSEAVTANLTFAPARVGRPVQLEALISGAWTSVATGFETNAGTAIIQLTATTIGTFSYRATAPAWNNAPAVSSASAQLTVTASHISVPDTTRPLTDAEAAAITSYDASSGTVVLANAPTTLATVVTGDAITLPPRDGAASGALRRVTGVTSSGATTTLSTEKTNLPAVIENVPASQSAIGMSVVGSEFVPEDGVTAESVPSAPGRVHAAGVRPASVGALKLAVSKSWESSDHVASVKLSGSISLAPILDASVAIDWFKLKGYKFGAGVQAANDLKATFAYKASASKKIPLGTLKQVWAGSIGPVPIWVEADFEIYVSWTIEGTLEVTAQVTQSGKISGGITNTSDSDLTPKLYTTTAESRGVLADLKASGELGLFAGAKADLMLYSLAGPYAALGAEEDIKLSGSLLEGFNCEISYGPHVEVGLKLSDAIETLTGKTYRLEAQIVKPLSTGNICPSTSGGGDSGGGSGGGTTALRITTTTLPAATVGTAYSAILAAAGGTAPYTWTATGLPEGLTLSPTGGLSGTPTGSGNFTLRFTLTDGKGDSVLSTVSLKVKELGEPAPVPLAAGAGHSCAVTGSGDVYCWGSNYNGLLLGSASTSTEDIVQPRRVAGVSHVVAVAAGAAHTCALDAFGGVKCWGDGSAGQLGDGSESSQTPVVPVGQGRDVVALSAGRAFTCALVVTGAISCWGRNVSGELGDGTTTQRNSPVAVQGLPTAGAIAAGEDHACAVTSGGEVYCWGANGDGQLGDGSTLDSPVPVKVKGLDGIVTVAAGSDFSCAVDGAGSVHCWGGNWDCQLGINDCSRQFSSPVAVAGLPGKVVSLTAGNKHVCVITDAGGVRCWGDNSYGQFGNGTSGQRSFLPTQPSGLSSEVSAIAAGFNHTCAEMTDGSIRCWGANSSSQTGVSSGLSQSAPVQVIGGQRFRAIATGGHHTCGITSTGGVSCWGDNGYGQLGDYDTALGNGDFSILRTAPTPVVGLTSGIVAVASGGSHTCALNSTGSVECWGNNGSGQVGAASAGKYYKPVPVSGLPSDVKAITAGRSHTCALTSSGSVWCWGDNSYGQLGDGTTVSRRSPTAVYGLGSGVVSVAAGAIFTCAVLQDGTGRCWGTEAGGALGDGGTSLSSLVPVAVQGLGDISAISAGAMHACAVTHTGAAWCWGSTSYGAVGDGTGSPRRTPVRVSGLDSGVSAITAGDSHTCAVSDAGLKCWGANQYGELGSSQTPAGLWALSPEAVAGPVGGSLTVSAGTGFTCALDTDSRAWCWGAGLTGQRGDGTGNVQATPVHLARLG